MPDLPLDFSAISNLYCARAYQLACVKGIDSSSPATDFGGAVHKFVEARGLGDTRSAITICAELSTKYKAPLDKLIMCAVKLDLVYKFGPPLLLASHLPPNLLVNLPFSSKVIESALPFLFLPLS